MRSVYSQVLAHAMARRERGQAVIAMGHCYMVGTEVSWLSERRILGGYQHALPANIFAAGPCYVALGHMHKAQRVGRDTIRYSGAPISLAISEARYRHQVVCVDVVENEVRSIEPVFVPRFVDVLRIPQTGSLPLEELLVQLGQLPGDTQEDTGPRPFLEVCVLLPQPQPTLRETIEAALVGKRPRLVKLSVAYTGTGLTFAESVQGVDLQHVDPEKVFVHRYQRDHDGDPELPLLEAFRELVAEAQKEQSS